MTGLAIGSIKARDEISEVVVVIAFMTWLLDTFVLVCFVFSNMTATPRDLMIDILTFSTIT